MMTHDAVGYKKEPTGRRRTDVCIPEAPRLTSHEWGVLFVLCGAIFLEGIDISMMGVALPSIRAELGLPTADLQWVVTAYVAGLRRIRAARRACGRPAGPAPHVRDLAGGVPRLLRPGRARHGGLDADPRPVRDRRGRGLPHPGRPVDHHHDVRRGTAAGPGPARLRRHRRRRILPRDGHRRPAHRPALAVGVLRARRRGRRTAGGGRYACSPARTQRPAAASTSPAR